MNVQHLHDLRDGKSIQRRRRFNPFVHIAINTPLMQMLFNITRPPQDAPVLKKKMALAVKKKVAATPTAGGSMVAYKKERKKF